MARVKRFLTVGAAVAAPALVAVVAMSGASTAQQVKPVNDVNVVNPVESPVPVAAQGTTQVGGTVEVGNLPATQQVAGTVDVGNLPSIQTVQGVVGIDPANNTVRFTQLPTISWAPVNQTGHYNGATSHGSQRFTWDIPEGQDAVVEDVSCSGPSGEMHGTLYDGGWKRLHLPYFEMGNLIVTGLSIRIKEPTVGITVHRYSDGQSYVSCVLNGYLLPE